MNFLVRFSLQEVHDELDNYHLIWRNSLINDLILVIYQDFVEHDATKLNDA